MAARTRLSRGVNGQLWLQVGLAGEEPPARTLQSSADQHHFSRIPLRINGSRWVHGRRMAGHASSRGIRKWPRAWTTGRCGSSCHSETMTSATRLPWRTVVLCAKVSMGLAERM